MKTAASGAPSLPPNRLRFDIAGCHLAALVLERLQYWTPRSRVKVRDITWIAKSRADLMRETGLTEKQLRTAIEKLKARGIVATSRHKFAGETILHLRLTVRGIAELEDRGLKVMAGKPGRAPEGNSGVALEGDTGLALEGNSHKQGDITGGYIQEEIANGSNDPSGSVPETYTEEFTRKDSETDMEGVMPVEGKKPPKSASELVAMFKTPKTRSATDKPGKKLSLGDVWQEAMVQAYPGEFQVKLLRPGIPSKIHTEARQRARTDRRLSY